MIQKRPTSAHAPRELRQTEMDGEVLRDLQRALAIHLGLLSEQFHAYLAREILLVVNLKGNTSRFDARLA